MQENEVRDRLVAAGIENARNEARWLCEALSGEALAAAVEKRALHYPLQYLLGEWEFYHESFEVSEHCLIPRADTELLVEKAVDLLPRGARFLDLCTGSGCVAISTLASRPDTTAVAVDLFDETLALAARNAVRNGVSDRASFQKANVLEAPTDLVGKGYAAILSNPPYIKEEAMRDLPAEVRHEPAAALRGGADGLDFYRAMLEKWRSVLSPDGFFLFEIGYDQAEDLACLARANGLQCSVWRDLGGNDRVVLLKK